MFFACGCIPVLVIWTRLEVRLSGTALAAVICAAMLNVWLSWTPPGRRRLAGAALLLGGLAGVLLSGRIGLAREEAWVGVELGTVAGFHGIARDDSYLDSRGRVVHTVGIEGATNAVGAVVDARGRARVICDAGPRSYRGQQVRVGAPLQESGPDVQYVSFARYAEVTDSGAQGRLGILRVNLVGAVEAKLDTLSRRPSGLLAALYLGRKDTMDPTLRRDFQGAGVAHVLALSGLHVGLLYGAVTGILSLCVGRRFRVAVGIATVVAYLSVIGFRPSLVRAGVMLACLGAGALLDRRINGLGALSLGAVVVLCLRPASVFSAGFQLSFAAVLGIVVLAPRLYGFARGYLPAAIAAPLCAGLAAQIGVAPVAAAVFGAVHPLAWLVSMVVVPTVALFMAGGLLYLLLPLSLAPRVLWMAEELLCGGYDLISVMVRWAGWLPVIRVDWTAAVSIPAAACLALWISGRRRTGL